MSFRPKYIPPANQSPEDIQASEQELQRIKLAAKQGEARLRIAHDQQIAFQKQEAKRIEQENIAAEASNLQRTPDVLDISQGLSIKNGVVVSRPSVPPSPAVTRVQQFTELNERARQNVRR